MGAPQENGFGFTPVQRGVDTVTSVPVVFEPKIILTNCQCLILAGWHRLKESPQGLLGVYIGLPTGKEEPSTQNVSMEVPPSYCSSLFFPPSGVDTEDSGGEMSALHSRLSRGMKICQITGLET